MRTRIESPWTLIDVPNGMEQIVHIYNLKATFIAKSKLRMENVSLASMQVYLQRKLPREKVLEPCKSMHLPLVSCLYVQVWTLSPERHHRRITRESKRGWLTAFKSERCVAARERSPRICMASST